MTKIEKQTERQHLREGLRLLRLAYQRPRKPDHPYEVADMATISVRELSTIERELHALWWGQARKCYLQAEIRRRGLLELRDLVFLCMRRLTKACSIGRYEGTPALQDSTLETPKIDATKVARVDGFVKPNVM